MLVYEFFFPLIFLFGSFGSARCFSVGFYSESSCTQRWNFEPLDIQVTSPSSPSPSTSPSSSGSSSSCVLVTSLNVLITKINLYAQGQCSSSSQWSLSLYTDSACSLSITGPNPLTGTGSSSCYPVSLSSLNLNFYLKGNCQSQLGPPSIPSSLVSKGSITASLQITPNIICPPNYNSFLTYLPISSSFIYLDSSLSNIQGLPGSSSNLTFSYSLAFAPSTRSTILITSYLSLISNGPVIGLNNLVLPNALFADPGLYEFTVMVSDIEGSVLGPIAGNSLTVISPQLSVNPSISISSSFSNNGPFSPDKALLLSSLVTPGMCNNIFSLIEGSPAYNFKWSITAKSPEGQTIIVPSIIQQKLFLNGASLLVPPYTLVSGFVYNFTVTAFPDLVTLGLSDLLVTGLSSISTYFSLVVNADPPIAIISGGLIREISSDSLLNDSFTVDGSSSFDPSVNSSDSSSSLIYKWSCLYPVIDMNLVYSTILSGSGSSLISSGSNCNSLNSLIINPNGNGLTARLPSSALSLAFSQNKSVIIYVLSLTVTSPTSGLVSLPTFAYFVINLKQSSIPLSSLPIVSISDVSGSSSAFIPLRLLGSLTQKSTSASPPTSVSWSWSISVIASNGTVYPLSITPPPLFIRSNLTGPNLIIDRSGLPLSSNFLFRVTVFYPFSSSSASFSLKVPDPPSSSAGLAAFTVSPLVGTACNTLFTLTATGWNSLTSHDFPLRYSFFAHIISSPSPALIGLDVPLSLHPSLSSSLDAYLPAGDLIISVKIFDKDGYSTTASFNISVALPSLSNLQSFNYSNSIECYAVSTCGSKLASSSSIQSASQSFQLAIAMQSFLPPDTDNFDTKALNLINLTSPLMTANNLCTTSVPLNNSVSFGVRANLRQYIINLIEYFLVLETNAGSSPSAPLTPIPVSLSASSLSQLIFSLILSLPVTSEVSSNLSVLSKILSSSISLLSLPASIISLMGTNSSDVSHHILSSISNMLGTNCRQSISSFNSNVPSLLISQLAGALLSPSLPGEYVPSSSSNDLALSLMVTKILDYRFNSNDMINPSYSFVSASSSWLFSSASFSQSQSQSFNTSIQLITYKSNLALCSQNYNLNSKVNSSQPLLLLSNVVVDASLVSVNPSSFNSFDSSGFPSDSKKLLISGLSDPIKFSLPLNIIPLLPSESSNASLSALTCPTGSIVTPRCAYFQTSTNSWSFDGCSLLSVQIDDFLAFNNGAPCLLLSEFKSSSSNNNSSHSGSFSFNQLSKLFATCQCSHLTEFAVINDPNSFSTIDRSIMIFFTSSYFVLCCISLIQLIRMIHSQGLVSSLLTLPVILHLHLSIFASTACNAALLLMRSVPSTWSISISTVPLVTVGTLIALPLIFNFLANSRFVLSWIFIARLSATKSGSDDYIKYIVYGAGILISFIIILLAIFTVGSSSLNGHVSYEAQSSLIEACTIIVALAYISVGVSTNVYGSYISCTVIRTASTLHLSGPTGAFIRLFVFGQILSILYAICGICWIISAVSVNSYYEDMKIYMTLGYTADSLSIIIILLMFQKGVGTLANTNKPNNSTKTKNGASNNNQNNNHNKSTKQATTHTHTSVLNNNNTSNSNSNESSPVCSPLVIQRPFLSPKQINDNNPPTNTFSLNNSTIPEPLPSNGNNLDSAASGSCPIIPSPLHNEPKGYDPIE